MKFLALVLVILSFPTFAAVVTSNDREGSCTLYQSVRENEQGEVVLQPGQHLLSNSRTYGLSFLDLEIDFERREARVQTMMNIILGLNRTLVAEKSVIKEGNPEFTFLVNQINRKVSLFEKICIGAHNEIVYAKYFESEEQ